MNKHNLVKNLAYLTLFLIASACSTIPTRQATIGDLEELKLDKYFNIDNSLKEILDHLNKNGEVVIEGVSKKTKTMKSKPLYIKIMATTEGLKTSIFPREVDE